MPDYYLKWRRDIYEVIDSPNLEYAKQRVSNRIWNNTGEDIDKSKIKVANGKDYEKLENRAIGKIITI